MKLKETAMFLREGVSNFHHTGSLFPTTQRAASTLASPLHQAKGPRKILEVGAGTGSVTVEILRRMIPGDTLTICEVNPRFMKTLRSRLDSNKDFRSLKNSISFFEGLVQDISEAETFDVIVCALPFLNFPLTAVEKIFQKLEALSNDETLMTYYEYIGLRALGKVLPIPERRDRIRSIDKYFREKHREVGLRTARVWRNILPINVHLLNLRQGATNNRSLSASNG